MLKSSLNLSTTKLPDSIPPRIPENERSSPKMLMIFRVSPFGESGFLPPPVFFQSLAILLCSFLALLTIPRHFSFISITDLLHTPIAFTRSAISCQICILFLFVTLFENLLLMMWMFSSAASNIIAHSVALKSGLLALFCEGSKIFRHLCLQILRGGRRLARMYSPWQQIG